MPPLVAEINLFGTPALAAAQAAREAGNAPNTVLAAACSILGPRHAEQARQAVRALVEGFTAAGLRSALDEELRSRPDRLRWRRETCSCPINLTRRPKPC